MLSGQLQKTYQARLEALQKHALIGGENADRATFVLSHVEFVIMRCCEHSDTIEEALGKALESSNYNMEQINEFIAAQPSEVRVPWCKNTIGGFIAACHNLTSEKLRLQMKADPRQEKEQA